MSSAPGRGRGDALDFAPRRPESGAHAALAADPGRCRIQRLGNLLAVQQHRALGGPALFLACLRRERLQLGSRVPQILLLSPRFLLRSLRLLLFRLSNPPRRMGGREGPALLAMPSEVIQHGEVFRRVEQPARLALAVDFDQQAADASQQGESRRRIVDECAAAPVGADHAAQQKLAVVVEVVLSQQSVDRVRAVDGKHGNDAGAFAAARHDSRCRACAERQSQGIQQDRLAGACLTGKDRHTGAEVDIQAADQNIVAD